METGRDTRATPLTAAIAGRLRQLRKQQGLTTYDIADSLNRQGVTSWNRGTVSKLETGRRESVTAEELVALATTLKVSALELLYGEESAEAHATTFLAQRKARRELEKIDLVLTNAQIKET